MTAPAAEPQPAPQPAKRCNDCGIHKPVSEFHRRSGRPSGRVSYCRPCAAIRWKRWAYGEGV